MNVSELKKVWFDLNKDLSIDIDKEWDVLNRAYGSDSRHYHTLGHLSEVYQLLEEYYNGNIPETSLFALFYHDIVYSTLRGDNEERSAEQAAAFLTSLAIDELTIGRVREMIIATCNHTATDRETQIFLDADMAILGSSEVRYKEYCAAVRREYGIYPDILYNRGRVKFLEKIRDREHIFLTDWFRDRFEARAKINLDKELKSLK